MRKLVQPDMRRDILPDNWINYEWIITKTYTVLNYGKLTTSTKFRAILFIGVVKTNIRPDIRLYIRIEFKLSQVVKNDILHTSTKFHANLFDLKKVGLTGYPARHPDHD